MSHSPRLAWILCFLLLATSGVSAALLIPDPGTASIMTAPALLAAIAALRLRRSDATATMPGPTQAATPAATAAPARAWQTMLDAAPIGVWKLDRHGRTRFGNRHLAKLCGGRVPGTLGSSGLRLAGPGDPAGPLGLPTSAEVEADLPGPDGQRRTVSLSASPWAVDAGDAGGGEGDEVCLVTLLDVSALKATRARLEHLAEHDPLTGLANRAQFRAAIAAMCASHEGGGLLLLDLDGFRRTNARHGLAAGDAVLRAAAARLLETVRPDDLICRLDGDEFGVVAFGAGEAATAAIIDRIAEALTGSLRFEDAELPLSASIGAACVPSHATEPDELLRAADLALFEARAAGKGACCLFRPELRLAAERREQLREALAAAIEQPEFHLVFQPQRDMQAQRLVGAEALIRWQSSRLGRAVSPGEMLPIAAETGMMPALDAWVLETALGHLADWTGRADAPPLLSINISGVTLRDPGFADRVARGLLRHGIAPGRLEIEIPEDLAVHDLPDIQATLDRLHELGIRLALDDFGAGHSSLPHVVQLPVHRLKLDRSIVSGLPDDAKARAVLNATMALAKGMGIEVIGEGVETEAQAFALRRAGCHVLQGWLIAKPLPIDVLLPPIPLRARA